MCTNSHFETARFQLEDWLNISHDLPSKESSLTHGSLQSFLPLQNVAIHLGTRAAFFFASQRMDELTGWCPCPWPNQKDTLSDQNIAVFGCLVYHHFCNEDVIIGLTQKPGLLYRRLPILFDLSQVLLRSAGSCWIPNMVSFREKYDHNLASKMKTCKKYISLSSMWVCLKIVHIQKLHH